MEWLIYILVTVGCISNMSTNNRKDWDWWEIVLIGILWPILVGVIIVKIVNKEK